MSSLIEIESNDDGILEIGGRCYSKTSNSDDTFVDNDINYIEESVKSRSNGQRDENTLFESLGLDPKTCGEELKKLESTLGKAFIRDKSSPTTQNEESHTLLFQRLTDMLTTEFQVLKKENLNPSALVPSLGKLPTNSSLYAPGDWVEIEGLDMIWRLDMITRVIKTAPDDYDWNDPTNEGKEPQVGVSFWGRNSHSKMPPNFSFFVRSM
mmetsp:Transcript_3649/g.6889  ORF Transcript_3649/g.6889 Transcript_3649/m.6889 type:complete len:210 (-) Transcript_3649:246-875(-)